MTDWQFLFLFSLMPVSGLIIGFGLLLYTRHDRLLANGRRKQNITH